MKEPARTDTDISQTLDALTPRQREAATHVDGPLLILAGPGSGKTRVVTHRIAHLLSQAIPAWQILALTFTNKAADEMRVRLEQMAPGQAVWVGTFHRFCSRLLRQYARLVGLEENFSIYDTDDSLKILKEAVGDTGLKLTHASPERVAREISRAKNNLVNPQSYSPRPGHSLGMLVQEVYPVFQRRLLDANAVDFDDLLLHVANLLREQDELRRTLDERYRYILVDEYQDTNFAQYATVRALSQDYPNLAVTGDPDQSIYAWRGANLENILKFEHDFPKVRVVRLERNYRSTQRILRVADHLIANNARRKHKALYTENPEGRRVRLAIYPTGRDEAECIAAEIASAIEQGRRRPRDVAIFYRVNYLSRPLETALRSAGVPYQVIKGLEFYQRKEVKDILTYLQLIHNPRSEAAFRRIINTPPRRIGKTTVLRLTEYASRRRLSLLEAAREAGLIETLTRRAAVHLATFVAMYDHLCLSADAPLEEIMGRTLEETGYLRWLNESDDEHDQERIANLEELLNAAREFDEQHPDEDRLELFLEQASLVSDTDDLELETDRVSLMTLHAAKGLEFPVVYLVAVEEKLLPHERSLDDPEKLEEERRLLFVGITRAEEELQLSMANSRFFRGSNWPTIPSLFLMELPRDELELIRPSAIVSPRRDYASDEEADDLMDDFDAMDDVDPEAEWVPRQRRGKKPTAVAPVMTAADMLGKTAKTGPRTDPDAFCQGMLVNHPAHGAGKIVALSGAGQRRKATVKFFNSTREVTFILVHCDLQPLKSAKS